MSRKLSWKPRRRGLIYCSSACGGNCKYVDYLYARLKTMEAAKALGGGWQAGG